MILFPKGMFCTADGSVIFKDRNIIFNDENSDDYGDYQYSVPAKSISELEPGEVHSYNNSADEVLRDGFPFFNKCLYFYSSGGDNPEIDYAPSKPYQILGYNNNDSCFDVLYLYNTYGNKYRFYPDSDNPNRYIEYTLTLSGTGANVNKKFINNGTTYYTFDETISGVVNYLSGPYRGTTNMMSIVAWKAHDKYSPYNDYLVKSRVMGTARYWSSLTSHPYKVASTITFELSYGIVTLSGSYGDWWNNWVGDFEPEYPDLDNPYYNGGVSAEGGGGGNFSENSDTPETDSMPDIGAVGTGFATIFKPSIGQLKDLSELFWNSNVFTFLQNLVENITDMFTSLAMVPFEVNEGRTVSVTWLGIDTAVTLTLAAKQYYEFDMGSIDMANDSRIFTSGSVLDYSPFSKLGIYLPFIGYQELDIDECRGAVINLRYRIDILSGACVAILKVGGRDLYQFTGNCLTQIPITNESMQSLVSDAVNVGIAAAGVGATGASVGADVAEAAQSKSGIEFGDIANAHRSITRAESGLASASANAVIGSKPTFNKSGAISSSASMMAVKQPFLFLSTPRQSIPDHYQRYRGFPSNITSKLGDLSGFTVVEDIRLNGLVATSPEVAEIYDLLKKGVII